MVDSATTTPDGVNLESLQSWFRANVEGATDEPLSAELIAGGRSNLTYAITAGTSEWVLRRQPLGHVLPTAHDMAREYRVLAALHTTDVPVPRVYALCEDDTVNGGPFYVMERIHGVILRSSGDMAKLPSDEARRCSQTLVDTLAAIHHVDFEAVGLSDFGRPDGYLERQVRRWAEQWERSKTRDLPGVDELASRLRAALPASPPPTIVHGDYRLDNTMLATGDVGEIVAVLDWEMATLGDPLADLGLLLLYYGRPEAATVGAGSPIDANPGFLSRDALIDRYEQTSGRSVDALDFYEVLAMYKLAIIIEGIHARFVKGKTLGEGFGEFGAIVETLVEGALSMASTSSLRALRGVG